MDMKYFDQKNNRLVYIQKQADANFWDGLWHDKDPVGSVKSVSDRSYIKKVTQKYLASGSKILEGGCGRGQNVYALKRWGYQAVGVDYAEETVAIIKENFPELDIIYGDVRKLPFADNEFDGYWSFGVIEHFFNGYKDIAEEMKRVVKVGGYLFITFPHMSVLRRLKVILRQYPFFNLNEVDISNFYQFALDEKNVISYFNQIF